jgi:hypothetical protein
MNSVKDTDISSGHRLIDCDRLSLSSRGIVTTNAGSFGFDGREITRLRTSSLSSG